MIPQSAATGPQASTETRGRLFLVPNALDLGGEAGDLRDVLPDGVLRIAARLQYWAVEDARSTRAFLKRVHAVHPLSQALQALHIAEMPRPQKGRSPTNPPAAKAAGDPWADLLAPARAGHDLGVLSEAGLPGVADPGARLVDAAHRAGLEVQALPGPSSLVLALAASGLQGQQFAFVGYLPQEPDARARRIRELEAWSRKADQTQLLIETPYRNQTVMQALLAHLSPETRLSISIGLTLSGGFSRTAPVAQWRRETPGLSDRMPAVFALLGR
ncbi:MAG: SAM-dependent methyltransferase [Rubrivivax sp.]